MTTSNVPAVQEQGGRKAPAILGSLQKAATILEARGEQIASLLPVGIDKVRFAKVVLQSVRMNPRLLTCTQSSFLEAALECARLGLEPAAGQAYLIPRKNKRGTVEAHFQMGYQGKKALAYRGGKYAALEAHAVRENDHFHIQRGLHPDIVHRPSLDASPGPSVHWYAIAWPKGDGQPIFEHMNRAQVDAIMARSASSKDGPWVTDYDEMGRKTVFSRLAKWLDLEPEVAAAFEQDALREYGKEGAAMVLGHAASAAIADDQADLIQTAVVLEEEANERDFQRDSATNDLADKLEQAAARGTPAGETDFSANLERREAERQRQKAELEKLASAEEPAPPTRLVQAAREAAARRQEDQLAKMADAGGPQAGLAFLDDDDEGPQEDAEEPTAATPEQGAAPAPSEAQEGEDGASTITVFQGPKDAYPKWVGDYPSTRQLKEVLARMDNPSTIAQMWFNDSRGSVQSLYHNRLAELPGVSDPEALLETIIAAETK